MIKKIMIALAMLGFATAHSSVNSIVNSGVLEDGTEVYWQCSGSVSGPVKIMLRNGNSSLAFVIQCGTPV